MKSNKILILTTAFASILTLSGVGYVSVRQYQNYQEAMVGEAKQAQEQSIALRDAAVEIKKLKQESELAKQKQTSLEERVGDAAKSSVQNLSISSTELAPYLTGVVEIDCVDTKGSGSLWNLPGVGYVVLTNKHVVTKPYPATGTCWVMISDSERSKISGDFNTIGVYDLNPIKRFAYKYQQAVNSKVDIAVYPIENKNFAEISNPIEGLNYKISSLKKCPEEMPAGSPIVLLGFPAFTEKTIEVFGSSQNKSFRTITNGIISAHDTSVTGIFGDLPYVNYFVSAKIDSGNSGGIAFSKDSRGLCVLGIPTWLTVGNYETQGLIQNIHNAFYSK